MAGVKLDLKEFNKYVNLGFEGLKDNGNYCNGIMANLFKGFHVISDK